MMESALVHFLKTDYPLHFYVEWEDAVMRIRKEEHPGGRFEIRDCQSHIIQYEGQGVSVINNNTQVNVEVIDFEHYINNFQGKKAGEGNKCDFIIHPVAGNDFIIFNELTESASQYIKPFEVPTTGEWREGKLVYAKRQLEASIEKFYGVNDFLDDYVRRIALFSCRLTDKRPNSIMAKSMRAFRKSQRFFSNIQSHEVLVHGFVFELRIYNAEFKVIED